MKSLPSSSGQKRRPSNGRRFLESLENRVFLSVSQPAFTDFSSITGLVANGFGPNSPQNGTRLGLTSTVNNEARSVWWNQAVPIDTFTSHFSYVSSNSANSGDGFTFTLQNTGTSALGGIGSNLGYSGGTIGTTSVAVAFNLYNNSSYGSNFGFASADVAPVTSTSVTPADLHNGDTYNISLSYDGTTLAVTATDASNSAKTFHSSEVINLPQVLGADTATVGFTASTGSSVSTQELTSWTFTGSNAPTITTGAVSTPASTNTTSSALSVVADDVNGESGLTYTWSTLHTPPGAAAPTFSVNATNAAKNTAVTYFKDGTYRFRVTATNALGQSTTSDVSVVVQQRATAFFLSPHAQTVKRGHSLQYLARALDQFHHAMRTTPEVTWAVTLGSGKIGASSGLFTAGSKREHVVITATDIDDSFSGILGVTVV